MVRVETAIASLKVTSIELGGLVTTVFGWMLTSTTCGFVIKPSIVDATPE